MKKFSRALVASICLTVVLSLAIGCSGGPEAYGIKPGNLTLSPNPVTPEEAMAAGVVPFAAISPAGTKLFYFKGYYFNRGPKVISRAAYTIEGKDTEGNSVFSMSFTTNFPDGLYPEYDTRINSCFYESTGAMAVKVMMGGTDHHCKKIGDDDFQSGFLKAYDMAWNEQLKTTVTLESVVFDDGKELQLK